MGAVGGAGTGALGVVSAADMGAIVVDAGVVVDATKVATAVVFVVGGGGTLVKVTLVLAD